MRRWAAALSVAVCVSGACEAEPCEEDIRAQTGLERMEIELAGQLSLVEVARTSAQRERGWKWRRCGREALLLLPDTPPESMSVWGCGLVDPVALYFFADGQLVQGPATVAPCGGENDCAGCEVIESEVPVDGALELLDAHAPSLGLGVGDPVSLP